MLELLKSFQSVAKQGGTDRCLEILEASESLEVRDPFSERTPSLNDPCFRSRHACSLSYMSPRSPETSENKAGRLDFQNQRFEPDTGKTRKIRNMPRTKIGGFEKGLAGGGWRQDQTGSLA